MTTIEKISCNICGFLLSFATATVAAVGLHALVVIFWLPFPSSLFALSSRFAIVTAALVSTVICLLWWLKNEDMKRGVWCFMYVLTALAVISLGTSMIQ